MSKNFDDFLATLTPEVIEEICDIANSKTSELKGFANFANSIGVQNITITLELLNLYHDWLNS